MNKTKQKSSAGKKVLIFFIVFLILEMLIVFGVSFVFKNKDVTPSIGGYSLYLVDDSNMGKSIPKGSLVIASNTVPGVTHIGKAVLCEKVPDLGTGLFWLADINSKGENQDGVLYTVYQSSDTSNVPKDVYNIKADNIVGVAQSYYTTAGKVITFMVSKFGKICIAAGTLFLFILIEIIVLIATHESKDDDDEEEDEEELQPVQLDDFLFGGEKESEQIAKHLEKVRAEKELIFEETQSKDIQNQIKASYESGEDLAFGKNDKEETKEFKAFAKENPDIEVDMDINKKSDTIDLNKVMKNKTEEEQEELLDAIKDEKAEDEIQQADEPKEEVTLNEDETKSEESEKAEEIKEDIVKAPVIEEKAETTVQEKKEQAEQHRRPVRQRKPRPRRSTTAGTSANVSLEELAKLMEQEQEKLKKTIDS